MRGSQPRCGCAWGPRQVVALAAVTAVVVLLVTSNTGDQPSPDAAPSHAAPAEQAQPPAPAPILDPTTLRRVLAGDLDGVAHMHHKSAHQPACPPYTPSADPKPVFETTDTVIYENSPLSRHRPQHQFCQSPPPPEPTPPEDGGAVLTIMTPTKNPRVHVMETLRFLEEQSFVAWHWLLIDDHSDDPEAVLRLEDLNKHKRVTVIKNQNPPGNPHARNWGLKFLKTRYVSFLDDDDLFELTAYEKMVWFLESNPNLDLCGFYFVCRGTRNYTWTAGFHDGATTYFTENRMAGASVMRVSTMQHRRYDPAIGYGMEDWDFFLGMFEDGHWGYTLPENVFWYRTNPASFRHKRWPDLYEGYKRRKAKIRAKHPALAQSFPSHQPRPNAPLELATWARPFPNKLRQSPGQKNMLLLVPYLYRGGVETFLVKTLKLLVEDGWSVTLVCLSYDPPLSVEMRPHVMQYTHDVFVLPNFLRIVDFPRFLSYLIRSRSIGVVWVNNCIMGYTLLPALRPQFPRVRFVDMVHGEAMEWKHGGFPTYSSISQPYLDLTLSNSKALMGSLKDRNPKLNLDFIYIGVAIPASVGRKTAGPALSISVVARMSEGKRPLLSINAIIDAIAASGPYHAGTLPYARFCGDGVMLNKARALVKQRSASHLIDLLGSVSWEEAQSTVKASQLFVLTTAYEGPSLAVAEAMALGVPVIVSCVGGLPELVGDAAFGCIPVSGDDAVDQQLFTDSIAAFLKLPEAEKEAWGQRARARVSEVFDQAKTMPKVLRLMNQQWEAYQAATEPEFVARPEPDPQMQVALHLAVVESKYSTSLYESNRRRLPTPRKGLGKQIQDKCGEATDERTQWIDAIVAGKLCPDVAMSSKMHAELVEVSGVSCGQWCMFHMGREGQAGWELTAAGCFMKFESADTTCGRWYKQQP